VKYELLRPPRWVGARPHPTLGPYLVGGVVRGARSQWVILDVRESKSRRYPRRLLCGAITRYTAAALELEGARVFTWSWDRKPKAAPGAILTKRTRSR
jgi:hypothetical protein